MRTDDFRPSENVEDDREASASRGIPGGRGGLGIGVIVVIFIISWFLGIDPRVLLNGAQLVMGGGSSSPQTDTAPPVTAGTPNDPTGKFVALVLGDTEDTWKEIFAQNGRTYEPPKLRLFSGSEPTPCAFARSAMGPFYCPRDERVYLDTSFFNDLQNKFGGCSNSKTCQFSEAYVIAHEVGHHVQNQLGILPRVTEAQQAAASQTDANQLQVRVELQADCLAGVWANHSQKKHNSSSRAMSIRLCRPLRPSATIVCRGGRRAMSCPIPSRMAPPSNASAGSRPALRTGPSRAAIPSPSTSPEPTPVHPG